MLSESTKAMIFGDIPVEDIEHISKVVVAEDEYFRYTTAIYEATEDDGLPVGTRSTTVVEYVHWHFNGGAYPIGTLIYTAREAVMYTDTEIVTASINRTYQHPDWSWGSITATGSTSTSRYWAVSGYNATLAHTSNLTFKAVLIAGEIFI
ncbi:MAG: hypothetical protein LBK73_03085 [Treponema sp.]|jgi:hypothetical protein|nr:hypothetical protein [Treponema sp.]